MISILWAFGLALIASFLVTPVCRRLAPVLGWVDQPNARKLHLVPMPLLGGLAMYTAAVLAILWFAPRPSGMELVGILIGATLVMLVGLLDDRGLLHHQIKLMLAMPLAASALIASGIHLNVLTGLFGAQLPWVIGDYVLSLIWIVGITASFSIFDHMDGLCAGIAAIAAAFFVGLSVLSGQVLLGVLAAAVCGGALGFLRWNLLPAKIFMGDSGAMFLGFMMAVLGLVVQVPGQPPLGAWLVAILVLGVPIFDTLLVMVSRARRGLLPFASPGKDHTAHRLANVLPGQRKAVLALYGLGIACGLVALAVSGFAPPLNYLVVASLVGAVLVGIVFFERAPYEHQEKMPTPAKTFEPAPVPLGR